MNTTRRFRLKHLAVLTATGEECNVFLQGQLSSDLRELTATRAQPSSLNSAKGRVLAVLQLVRFGNAVLMVLPAATAPGALEHISKFVLRTKVKLQSAPDIACIGLAGPDAAGALESLGAKRLDTDWHTAAMDKMIAWRVPGETPRMIVAGQAKSVEKAFDSLEDLPTGDVHLWRFLDILAGLPEILPPTRDKFVAQMLRLDELGAISMTKGCYTGQEVIARAHYLGQVKRATAVGCTSAKRPLKPAEALKLDGKTAAIVVSSAPHPDGGQAVLAVLQGEHPAGTRFAADDGIEVSLGT